VVSVQARRAACECCWRVRQEVVGMGVEAMSPDLSAREGLPGSERQKYATEACRRLGGVRRRSVGGKLAVVTAASPSA